MKNKITILFAALLVFTSCSKESLVEPKNEVESVSEDRDILAMASSNEGELSMIAQAEPLNENFSIDSIHRTTDQGEERVPMCYEVLIHLTDSLMNIDGTEIFIDTVSYVDGGFIKWKNNSYYEFTIETKLRWSFFLGDTKITYFLSKEN